MKKLFAILTLFAIGSFVLAQDTDNTKTVPDTNKKNDQKVEKAVKNADKKSDSKKQLTAKQQAKIARKQASKERKITKQRTKREELIKINQKHLEYKKRQLEQLLEESKTKNTTQGKEENSQKVTEDNTEE